MARGRKPEPGIARGVSRAPRARQPEPGYSLSRVSWREWAALVAGVVAIGSLFLPWTVLSAGNQEVEEALNEQPHSQVVRDAFTTGLLAWAGPVLLVLAGIAVLLLGQRHKVRVSGLPQLWLIAAAVALVLMVLAWIGIGWQFEADARALLHDVAGVGFYGGFGRYLAMACGVVSVAMAVLDVRSARGEGED